MLRKESFEYLLKTNSAAGWKRIGPYKRAGVCVPFFSLYSKKSLGVGDFSDLKLLIDWAHLTGNSVIQLLPVNQVGSTFCPYDSVSSFALDPMFICIRDINLLKDKTIENKLNNLKKVFPAGNSRLDYAIKEAKVLLLRELHAGKIGVNSFGLKAFIEENAYWLSGFALYMSLKEYHKGRPWYDWSVRFKNRDREALSDFKKEHEQEIDFQVWLQWQLYLQFKSLKEYAGRKKILLKGDLPILVSRDSADVWANPELFKLEFCAGAPPDMYCAKGQRWGMPTYNWERIASDGYRYLKEKLKYSENFYDILRIDHVVGLFRSWSIPFNEPTENKGLNGRFDPADESSWLEHGRNILLSMLGNTNMLLCAEDLGVIPKVCTDTLRELGIPGNDVQRWVKDWEIKHDFLEPEKYRVLSVAMLSTHDTTNWPAWWEKEAGTVDEDLFIRKCSDRRQINFGNVKNKLFDLARSGHGRLRWLNSVDSVEKLVAILGEGLSPQTVTGQPPSKLLDSIHRETVPQSTGTLPKEHLLDFIDLYLNSYQEKEKLWKHLKLSGSMREECDSEIVRAALKITLDSSAIFCINTIIDWLYLADIFKGGPYQYRINTPGTISDKNWSLTIPFPLEELLKHMVNKDIRKMIADSGRI
ncbi:MAG: 4-alpha-glucanotransferase [Candidatus Omnitrophota bacterium]